MRISASTPKAPRRLLEQELGRRVGDRDWARLVSEIGDDPEDPAQAPDERTWFEDAKVILGKWWEADESLRVSLGPRVLPVSSEDPRYAGLAEILAIEASHDPHLIDWRQRHLPDGLIDESELPQLIARLRREGAEHPRSQREPTMTFRYVSGETERSFPVVVSSSLGELARLADRLSRGYHWLVDDAQLFVLTGRPPSYYPLIARLRITDRAATSRIRLDIDPRTPRGELVRQYDRLRKDPAVAVVAAAGSGRRIEERTQALAVFVARRLGEPWRSLQAGWNDQHPNSRYESERAFASAARRAWRHVVGGKLPRSRDQWLSDVRSAALTDSPPGTLPRGD